jgi:hypothetical protein
MTTPTAPDFLVCEDCNLVVRPADAFATHLASAAHAERMQGNFARCSVCAVCLGRAAWSIHVESASHHKKAAQQGLRSDLPPEVPAQVPNHKRCRPCGIFIPEITWDAHLSNSTHFASVRSRQQIDEIKDTLQDANVDQEGSIAVSHSGGLDVGILDISAVSNGLRAELVIEAHGSNAIHLVHARIPKGKKKQFSNAYVYLIKIGNTYLKTLQLHH